MTKKSSLFIFLCVVSTAFGQYFSWYRSKADFSYSYSILGYRFDFELFNSFYKYGFGFYSFGQYILWQDEPKLYHHN